MTQEELKAECPKAIKFLAPWGNRMEVERERLRQEQARQQL